MPPSTASARNTYASLTVNNVKRGAVVHLPSTYNGNQRFPVLLAFHGSNGTGAGLEATTGFDKQADKYGFVVVYPDSVGPRWDNQGTTDLQFVQTLLAALASKFSLDPQRVYATGYSDGGGFAQVLVCSNAASYAGIATVGTNMGNAGEALCRPSQPLTYLSFHGTSDPDVPYGGGLGSGPYAEGQSTNSTPQVFQFWASLDGCTALDPNQTIPDQLASGGHVTDVISSTTPCRNGTSATLYSITDGGHTWPGGTQTYSPALGDISKDVNASAIILETLGPHRSAAGNTCFEGASTSCGVAYGLGSQTCVGGQLGACMVASCKRGFTQQGGNCVSAR